MNPDTGAIAIFETDEDAQAAGYTKKLTPKEVMVLGRLNRHERRKQLAEWRRAAKARKGRR